MIKLSKKGKEKSNNFIIIVSGLPRSGTSMMMKILEAGGIEVLTDGLRRADEDNPKGYYEFERVKKLPEGDYDWLNKAINKSVKVISALLEYLPDGYKYKIIFMERDLKEILKSQRKMMERKGVTDDIDDKELENYYKKHLNEIKEFLKNKKMFDVIYVNYNYLLVEPEGWINAIIKFLGTDLNKEKMLNVIDINLYRNREK